MQIQYTKNLIPGRFELGTTLSKPNRSIQLKYHLLVSPAYPDFPVNRKMSLNIISNIRYKIKRLTKLSSGEITFCKQKKRTMTWSNLPWVLEDIFFLSILMARGEAASTRSQAPREKKNWFVSEAWSNRKHGLFHIRYFENGPLEPG